MHGRLAKVHNTARPFCIVFVLYFRFDPRLYHESLQLGILPGSFVLECFNTQNSCRRDKADQANDGKGKHTLRIFLHDDLLG